MNLSMLKLLAFVALIVAVTANTCFFAIPSKVDITFGDSMKVNATKACQTKLKIPVEPYVSTAKTVLKVPDFIANIDIDAIESKFKKSAEAYRKAVDALLE